MLPQHLAVGQSLMRAAPQLMIGCRAQPRRPNRFFQGERPTLAPPYEHEEEDDHWGATKAQQWHMTCGYGSWLFKYQYTSLVNVQADRLRMICPAGLP